MIRPCIVSSLHRIVNPPIVSLCTWLAINLFMDAPSSLCACKSPIDPLGDHLLGCGFGPFRIHRHNALCNNILHSLLQDNANTRCEQQVSGDSQACPGDVYHPDFTNSHPTYLDVSVRNTMQTTTIN